MPLEFPDKGDSLGLGDALDFSSSPPGFPPVFPRFFPGFSPRAFDVVKEPCFFAIVLRQPSIDGLIPILFRVPHTQVPRLDDQQSLWKPSSCCFPCCRPATHGCTQKTTLAVGGKSKAARVAIKLFSLQACGLHIEGKLQDLVSENSGGRGPGGS